MKLLAYSRRDTRQAPICNLTVYEVSPSSIPARQSTVIVITASASDCQVQAIQLGDDNGEYSCSSISSSGNNLVCTAPAIPIPGDYPVSILFQGYSTYADTSGSLTVLPNPLPPGTTQAIFSLTVFIELGMFIQQQLLDLLAAVINVPASDFDVFADTVSTPLLRSTTYEQHAMILSLTSNNVPTASQLINLLLEDIDSNPSSILPYMLKLIDFNALCDSTGQCTCGPNFLAPLCTTAKSCPNNCSGNGECTLGDTGVICSCASGWEGNDCSAGQCINNCNGNGECVLEEGVGNGTCYCSAGWSGPNCAQSTPSSISTGGSSTGENLKNNPSPSSPGLSERSIFIIAFTIVAGLLAIAGAVAWWVRYRRVHGAEE